MRNFLQCTVLAGVLACALSADPVLVHHPRGYLRGFLVLKDSADKTIAAGDVIQRPSGSRVTNVMTLRFRDGSLYQETAVFSQRHTFKLLSYKLIQKGPSFKIPETLSFDTTHGNIKVEYTDKHGDAKNVDEHMDLPADLANGLVPTLLTEVNPTAETILSMLVLTPKPRIVKLKISASGEDAFSVGGFEEKATHYVVKIDIGGVTGVAAKIVGKQPPPVDVWIAAGNAPIFLKSEGPLYEDGPIWRIELASPSWPAGTQKQ